MKRTIKIFALLLVVTLALTALVACGYDPQKNKKALEEKGYTVTVEEDEEELAELCELFGLEKGDVKSVLYATNGKEGDEEAHITIIYCKDNDAARKLYGNSNFDKALRGNRGRENSVIWVGMSEVWDDAQ